MDPLGDILYVANANTDSTFGGSTLVSIDLLRYEHAVSCYRKYGRGPSNDDECGRAIDCADLSSIGTNTPIEVAEATEAATGKSPANYDRCYCEFDLEDEQTTYGADSRTRLVNCESQRFILADQTVKAGFFKVETNKADTFTKVVGGQYA